MIIMILISQILIQTLFQYEHSTQGYIALFIALAFCAAVAQARWCAIWAKQDDLEIQLKKSEGKAKKDK